MSQMILLLILSTISVTIMSVNLARWWGTTAAQYEEIRYRQGYATGACFARCLLEEGHTRAQCEARFPHSLPARNQGTEPWNGERGACSAFRRDIP